MRKALVYILTGRGLCKVGFSKDIVRRSLEIERAAGFALSIYAAYPFNAYARIERESHRLLAPARAWLEWYSCAPVVAAGIIEGVAARFGEMAVPHHLVLRQEQGADVFCLEPAHASPGEATTSPVICPSFAEANKRGIAGDFGRDCPIGAASQMGGAHG